MNNLKDYILIYGVAIVIRVVIILFVVFSQPAFGYKNNKEFIESVNRCADYLEKGMKREERIP